MELNCIIQLKNTLFSKKGHEIDKNHDIQAKSDNWKLGKKWVKKICDILSARIQLVN